MEWSIQDVARTAGTTSRTLRHYDDIGLLTPARIGSNGYRYYDQESMVRLQRILLLRELGLSLPVIAEVLSRQTDTESALRTHVGWLRDEQSRLDRQIGSIERTLTAMQHEGALTMETMFDGFDHTEYREEVERRWGADAYASSATWWESKTEAEQAEWQQALRSLNQDWIDLAASGADPHAAEAQALAARHVAWLSAVPGTPATDPASRRAYVTGLAAMYVADPRFAANYGGEAGAVFVRAALERYAETRL
ncbi:MAG TPA: MerR family transcriptional regulator [Microbacteriaceae bacterium]|nr:MerR family transcriptional regulator [Microbacteriaceae bacterium]